MGKNLFVKEIVSAFNFEGKFVSDNFMMWEILMILLYLNS